MWSLPREDNYSQELGTSYTFTIERWFKESQKFLEPAEPDTDVKLEGFVKESDDNNADDLVFDFNVYRFQAYDVAGHDWKQEQTHDSASGSVTLRIDPK